MKLSQFKFKLPEEQIAVVPPYHRDECRLMVVHRVSKKIDMYKTDDKGNPLKDKEGNPEFLDFRNILDYFDESDVFVFNDTKVFPARLYGTKEKTDAKIEVFLLRELNEEMRLWDVLVEPARKIRIGNKLFFDGSGTMVAEVIDNTTSRGRTLRFLYDCPHDEFKSDLYRLGEAPLPYYIIDKRREIIDRAEKEVRKIYDLKENTPLPVEVTDKWEEILLKNGIAKPMPECGDRIPEFLLERREATAEDSDNFQCIFAKNEGAVTAPASGLHFSRELLKRMEIRGIEFAYITLHCGLGNFHSIEVEDLTKHKMDSEQMFIGPEACKAVNGAKHSGRHVCAVGTSVMKATETAVGTDKLLKEYEGWTNKFLFPPYECNLADSMIVNFYHPMSTLVMATAAFGGYDLVMEAYDTAVKNGYKFGCYGDAMLILND